MNNTQQLTQLIQQHLPEQEDTLKQYLALKNTQSTLPTVVVYGVYSSGKSSLLNSLTEQIAEEYFATARIPETRELKAFEFQEVRYIDTPGLDVNVDDTRAAKDGAFQADILIFTHRLSTGVVQKADIEAMQTLAKAHQNTHRIVVVLTDKESTDSESELIASITKQFREFLPTSEVFSVSNPSFIKGKKDNKNGLVKYSGIVSLQQHIQAMAKEIAASLQEGRRLKQQVLLTQLNEELELTESKLKLEITKEELKQIIHQFKLVNNLKDIQAQLFEQDLHNIESLIY